MALAQHSEATKHPCTIYFKMVNCVYLSFLKERQENVTDGRALTSSSWATNRLCRTCHEPAVLGLTHAESRSQEAGKGAFLKVAPQDAHPGLQLADFLHQTQIPSK